MTTPSATAAPGSRLARLRGFLHHDPQNLALLADAAEAALDEGDPDEASALVDRYAEHSPLTTQLLNLKGLAAMELGRFEQAAEIFQNLADTAGSNPGLRFNLAWCRSMMGDHAGALVLLDDDVLRTTPASAALQVRTLHHLGRPGDALSVGAELATKYPADETLMAALATAALDAEDLEQAATFAQRAAGRPEGQAVLGMLALGDNDIEQSMVWFDRALEGEPASARALIGKGLGLLTKGETAAATSLLEQGAAVFGDHLGSWIAVGWAQFSAGDYGASRATFEKTLLLDDTFAESHGALAVLDLLAGDAQSAKRRSQTALRLDRQCLSGALAQSLIAAGAGDADRAERIRSIALNTPIGPGGQTIAQAMARYETEFRGGKS